MTGAKLRNHRTVTLKLSRHEVCDLLIALTATRDASNGEHWSALRDKVKSTLEDFDKKLDEEEEQA